MPTLGPLAQAPFPRPPSLIKVENQVELHTYGQAPRRFNVTSIGTYTPPGSLCLVVHMISKSPNQFNQYIEIVLLPGNASDERAAAAQANGIVGTSSSESSERGLSMKSS